MSGIADRRPRFLKKLLDLIYPRACVHCDLPISDGKSDLPFCSGCWGTIRPLAEPRCPVCAAPFSSPSALSHSPDHHCAECREHPPAFSRAITPYAYEGILAEAIQRFKYQKQTSLADPLAGLLVEALTTAQFDRVAAVPLHPARLRTREFNQSLLLAQRIARFTRVPLLIDALHRSRDTLPQVGLSRKERERNVRRAFHPVRSPIDPRKAHPAGGRRLYHRSHPPGGGENPPEGRGGRGDGRRCGQNGIEADCHTG